MDFKPRRYPYHHPAWRDGDGIDYATPDGRITPMERPRRPKAPPSGLLRAAVAAGRRRPARGK